MAARKKRYKIFKGVKKESWVQKMSHFIPLIVVVICAYLSIYHNVPLFSEKAAFGGIIPILGLGGLLYLFVYASIDPSDLTNNVEANKVVSPIVFILVFNYAQTTLRLPAFGSLYPYYGAIGYSSLFTFIYLYTSHFFQPDLDVYGSRPGMKYFPLGKKVGLFQLGRYLQWVFYPITRGWFHLWTPYAFFATHRGITHWPILSTWFRVGYLLLLAILIKSIINFVGIDIPLINLIIDWAHSFYPWMVKGDFFSAKFILYCLPVYLTDFVHILVDYIDSFLKGTAYCDPKIRRGYISILIKELKKNF